MEDEVQVDPENKNENEKKNTFLWRDLFQNKVFDLMIVGVGVTIAFN